MRKTPILALIIASFITVTAMISCQNDDDESSENNIVNNADVSPSELDMQVFDLINKHRESIGVTKLIFNEEVFKKAYEHTQYMVKQNNLSHDGFEDRISAIENIYSIGVSAENVAYNYSTNAEDVVNQWLDSEGHKNNLETDELTHSAVATINDNGKIYYTQLFIEINQ